ncbi:hypothetical protein K470DRAFT_285955 [Piedraia hortae CBS 480.64]|uniref:Uncharacterized protein n=1 Tax=Piedraia hortae CBS 480.64 TaxID=1314780 RepID=A0A6A7C2B2_9PEZI|nr:hypothetical protein K470DRAFT_285955 [Piedraia hortae CBS 480.64]
MPSFCPIGLQGRSNKLFGPKHAVKHIVSAKHDREKRDLRIGSEKWQEKERWEEANRSKARQNASKAALRISRQQAREMAALRDARAANSVPSFAIEDGHTEGDFLEFGMLDITNALVENCHSKDNLPSFSICSMLRSHAYKILKIYQKKWIFRMTTVSSKARFTAAKTRNILQTTLTDRLITMAILCMGRTKWRRLNLDLVGRNLCHSQSLSLCHSRDLHSKNFLIHGSM